MPVTTRSNLVIPEILADAVAAAWPGKIALLGSEAVIESNTLPNSVKGGDTIKVPYFNVFGNLQIVSEGTPLTPVSISMTSETATVQHAGSLHQITTWAQMAANYADPYGEISRQLIEAAQRKFDEELLNAANATTPSSGQITVDRSTGTITYDAVVDAVTAFADEMNTTRLAVLHSKVFTDLLKLKDTTRRPLINTDNNTINCGPISVPYILSDRAPIITGTPNKYVTLLVRRGALALWYNQVPEVKTDYDISSDSYLLGIHVYFAAHRYQRVPGSAVAGVVRLITQ